MFEWGKTDQKKGGFLVKRELILRDIGHQGCFKTIEDAVNLLFKQLKTENEFYRNPSLIPIFRGESRGFGLTCLQPSMFRVMALESKPSDYEKKLITRFLDQYSRYKNLDSLSRLSMMQHYSFPTRLLDWTKKFQIALYFACNNNLTHDGFLYIFAPTLNQKNKMIESLRTFYESIRDRYIRQCFISHTEEAHKGFWTDFCKEAGEKISDIGIPWCLAFEPRLINGKNQREEWQKSVYTFHLGYVSGKKLYVAPPDFAKEFIQQHSCQIIIPARFKKQCLNELKNQGIQAATLFPEPMFFDAEYET